MNRRTRMLLAVFLGLFGAATSLAIQDRGEQVIEEYHAIRFVSDVSVNDEGGIVVTFRKLHIRRRDGAAFFELGDK